jgi:hypothetical protein
MKRTANQILMVCLLSLPAAAFADVYPLAPPPDLFIDTITYTGSTLTGTVEGITDIGACSAIPCSSLPPLEFIQTDNGVTDTFEVVDISNDVYLAGSLITNAVGAGGEAGELFSITTDATGLWSVLEGQPASSFGNEVALDLHDFSTTPNADETGATGDLAPLATPEPASLTLLFSGLVAGLARKRMAGKRSKNILA